MQGRSEDQRDLLDAEFLSGHLLKPGSVFAFLAEHRGRLFPDEMFADLFRSGTGRPSVPADVMAAVIVLQTLHGFSDAETTDAVTFDLRWKAAIGWPITAKAFHDTTLTYWRRRLAASDRPNRIFEAVQQVVAETGALKGKTRRALDSTVLDDAVATQDTVTQLIGAVRRVRREVPGAAEVVARVTSAHDYDDPGKPRIAWNDEQARQDLVDALVRDARAVLDALGEQADSKAADAVGLLALVAGQDVELVDAEDPGDPPRWQIARRVAPDRVISTVDPEARHAHKTVHRRQDGFKAHLAVEPETGIVTACELTKASGEHGSDGNTGIRLLAADPTLEQQTVQVLADSAYASGDALAALAEAKHEPLVKPWPVKPTIEGGFTVDDFTVDEAAGTATCPAGVTRRITKTRAVVFGVACRDCPLQTRCTTAERGRNLHLHEHDQLMREHRQRAKDPAWQEIYRQHRPMVERSIAWLTAHGNRKVRYRGVAKNDTWLKHRVAALNLRRLLNLGLTHQDGTWALA
jgi:hypothetical protein